MWSLVFIAISSATGAHADSRAGQPVPSVTECASAEATEHLLKDVRRLLASRQSVREFSLQDDGVKPLAPGLIKPVTASAICARALVAYRANNLFDDPADTTRHDLRVVETPTHFFVDEPCASLSVCAVAIFTRRWKHVVNYGRGL